jgi:hypothetical protein
MRFKDKLKTRVLLWLERQALALRQQNRLNRETARRVLRWIDEQLAAKRNL